MRLITGEQRAQIVVLYTRGIYVKRIAAEVGCGVSTVTRIAKMNGLRRNSRADAEEFLAGDTPQQVQRCLNCKAKKCNGGGRRCPLWG